MTRRVWPGPEPLRLRLENIDAVACGEAVRDLIRHAQTGEPAPCRSARRMIESVQVAYDALRARERIARGEPVPPRWLAALANVATSRVRQCLRDRVLERVRGGVSASSAADWLKRRRQVASSKLRLVAAKPTWWDAFPLKGQIWTSIQEAAQQALAGEFAFRVDYRETPCFEIPAGTRVNEDHVEELRTRLRDALERIDPRSAAPRPDAALEAIDPYRRQPLRTAAEAPSMAE